MFLFQMFSSIEETKIELKKNITKIRWKYLENTQIKGSELIMGWTAHSDVKWRIQCWGKYSFTWVQILIYWVIIFHCSHAISSYWNLTEWSFFSVQEQYNKRTCMKVPSKTRKVKISLSYYNQTEIWRDNDSYTCHCLLISSISYWNSNFYVFEFSK